MEQGFECANFASLPSSCWPRYEVRVWARKDVEKMLKLKVWTSFPAGSAMVRPEATGRAGHAVQLAVVGVFHKKGVSAHNSLII